MSLADTYHDDLRESLDHLGRPRNHRRPGEQPSQATQIIRSCLSSDHRQLGPIECIRRFARGTVASDPDVASLAFQTFGSVRRLRAACSSVGYVATGPLGYDDFPLPQGPHPAASSIWLTRDGGASWTAQSIPPGAQ